MDLNELTEAEKVIVYYQVGKMIVYREVGKVIVYREVGKVIAFSKWNVVDMILILGLRDLDT